MNKKFLSTCLLTLGLIGTTTATMNAAETRSLWNTGGGSYSGEATETGYWFSDAGTLTPATGPGATDLTVEATAGITVGTTSGLHINPSEVSYSSGTTLSRNSKAYITIPVSNYTTDASGGLNYDNVRIKYTGSQNNILNVSGKTGTVDIDAEASPDNTVVDYIFEVKLNDDALGYVDYADWFASQENGHAPLVEDLEFTISGVQSTIGTSEVKSFNESFYLGNPETVTDGSIALDYNQDAIEVTPTEEAQDVCYNGYARADYTITNNGTEFIYINASKFQNNDTALDGMVTENGGSLTFLFNEIDLAPYWTGDQDMYANMEYDEWQNFTINPGESATVSIIAEGESLADYEEESLPATVTLPMSDYNGESADQDIVLTMNYYYDEEDPECEASGNGEDTDGEDTDGEDTDSEDTDSEDTTGSEDTDSEDTTGTGSTMGGSLTNTASTSALPLVLVAMGTVVALRNKFIK